MTTLRSISSGPHDLALSFSCIRPQNRCRVVAVASTDPSLSSCLAWGSGQRGPNPTGSELLIYGDLCIRAPTWKATRLWSDVSPCQAAPAPPDTLCPQTGQCVGRLGVRGRGETSRVAADRPSPGCRWTSGCSRTSSWRSCPG